HGIARKLKDGMDARIFIGENVMISVVQIAPGVEGKPHSHPEEQWGFVIKGGGERMQDGVTHTVAEGDFWYTPGGVEHGFQAGADGAVLITLFSPPRADYRSTV